MTQDEDVARAMQDEVVNLRHPAVHVEAEVVKDGCVARGLELEIEKVVTAAVPTRVTRRKKSIVGPVVTGA
jgi:hypothetical protein